MADHLSLVKNHKYRHAISKIRCSSHLLQIEKGRHANPKIPIDERLCSSCGIIEDEFHFVIECTLFDDNRSELFKKIANINQSFLNMNSRTKFIYLLSSNDSGVLTNLGKFIYASFLTRETKMK